MYQDPAQNFFLKIKGMEKRIVKELKQVNF
jgi:hypothetical protein